MTNRKLLTNLNPCDIMNTEIKKGIDTMTEKVVYIADDGTQFEYEDDCYNYETEQELLPLFEKVQMWDCCEKPIPTPTNYEEARSALEELHFIRGSGIVELWEAIYDRDLERGMLDFGSFRDVVYEANDTDLLMFDGDVDYWVNVSYLFDEYRRILKKFS